MSVIDIHPVEEKPGWLQWVLEVQLEPGSYRLNCLPPDDPLLAERIAPYLPRMNSQIITIAKAGTHRLEGGIEMRNTKCP